MSNSTTNKQTSHNNFFCRLTQIEPEEIKAALLAFLFIFLLMTSYMILKPVRDALPSDWGDVSRAVQWTYTFIFATLAVMIYNYFSSHISVRKLVPRVFFAFAISFMAIYAAFKLGVDVSLLGKVFYVWTSVFSLFHISVFWSFISQHYSKSQSKRVFSFINTGASAGAILGPLIVIVLAEAISIENALLVTSSILLISLPIIALLNKHFDAAEQRITDSEPLQTNPFSGLSQLLSHKKLMGIASFIFLLTGVSAFFYTTQSDVLAEFSRAERKQMLGGLELITNTLTILIGLFVSNRIFQKLGISFSLSFVPFAIAGLMLLLSANPVVLFVLILVVLRRAGNYAIVRPAREVLFTGVDREARFKTKPIIDIAVYRGGDVFWIWTIAFIGDGYLGFSMAEKIIAGAVVAILWGLTGMFIGRKHDNAEQQEASEQAASAELKPCKSTS
ncbi:MFS transporter [Saccharobesus litoralis]|uniref:MFS transporter n=1 Tax=Saccharobesus litoralis TaxID=2172099 RepID=A0A2S0VVE5_9ALTE|nr:MFS transporter [Saccharobesus litoralis]AWB68080.1 MFS transporter [Saccharobesus litoralis]